MSDSGWAIAIVGAYLCGSIPFGLLIGLARGIDIREQGSRNIGATNCGRVLGKRWGRVCFALDFLKGAVPVAAAGFAAGVIGSRELSEAEAGWWIGAAAAAVCGHVFPIWLRFRGGKGVATAFGALVGVWPILSFTAGAGAVVWFIVAAASRFVSLASIVATIVMIAYSIVVAEIVGVGTRQGWPLSVGVAALAMLVLIRHRGNLRRIVEGTENRIGATPQAPNPKPD